MEVLVPFSADRPKSRLADTLSPSERAAFARAMLADVLSAIVDAGGDPRVLATDEIDPTTAPATAPLDPPVTVDDRPLTDAVNAALEERRPGEAVGAVAVVMADLALATPEALERLFGGAVTGRRDGDADTPRHAETTAPADVTIAPGRGGGTNALVVSHPRFRVDYHGASYLDHRRIAAELGATVRTVDSYRLATDVDEHADLAEVLLHGDGAAVRWLREAGFALDADGGRVGVVRE
ncbi:2-phospho-L-lactate guanylyltransferase [Halorubrum sp. 48-1-W]|uniref:2-phospho-L-lactate guanylyltransferase n=1 Tax=Halorubrum sp. 48-1-W TaxID=2249761 RepID=UPI000DCDE01A|nr:2-phospho-L-lactate guanylyltransferase [Halorubrum sp. 48-1-W]RAW44872.1 2-phospho-L-lactate guanylyltransferase [Halorubrum sp. 48-1-W]